MVENFRTLNSRMRRIERTKIKEQERGSEGRREGEREGEKDKAHITAKNEHDSNNRQFEQELNFANIP